MIKMIYYLIITTSVLMGVFAFAKIRNHIISTLISLEFASLSVYLYLFMLLTECDSEKYIALVYLTFAACEGALGLSILVSVIKSKGNDFIKASNFMQC
nr:NADH dehydrogenase subunit 4L [Procloeon bifidum]